MWCLIVSIPDLCSFLVLYNRRFNFTLVIQNLSFKPKTYCVFPHLKCGIQDFHTKYALVPADKAANNVVVVLRLYYVDTLKREFIDTNHYKLQVSLMRRLM